MHIFTTSIESDESVPHPHKVTDQFNYLQFLSTTAHSLNLGIALKNGPDMISKKPEIVSLTDFVIIEECQAYNECNAYQPFVNAGKAAFQVE